jgi:hypothetical protein
MTTFGITDQGFTLKRLADIIIDMDTSLALVQDPITGETLNLLDENDPLMQLKFAVADQLSAAWEQLGLVYNSLNPLAATGAPLAALVQLNGILKQLGDTDTVLRLKQQNETALTSYRQVEAIYAGVSAVPGVQFCRVYQNSTISDPDTRGIPAKSIAVVVVGGDDQAIANAIFEKAAVGLGIYGTTTKTCIDAQGLAYDIKFIRPTAVPIIAVINISVVDTILYPSNGADLIKAALVAYAAYGQAPNIGLYPGLSIVNTRLYSPVNTVQGMEIDSIQLARDAGSPAVQNITIQWDEVAQITSLLTTVNVI